MRFRDLPIKTKLTIFAIASSTLSIGLCCLGFVSNDLYTFKMARIDECRALADVLSRQSASAVSRGDRTAATETLAALDSQKIIDGAELLDANGGVAASWGKPSPQVADPHTSGDAGYAMTAAGVQIWTAIHAGDRRIGTLLLSANFVGQQARLHDSGRVALFVLIVAVNVVIFFISCVQKVITKPIVDLAEAAKKISEDGDYTVRAAWESEDEIGQIHLAYNIMLDHIEASERALTRTHGELQRRMLGQPAETPDEASEGAAELTIAIGDRG